MDRERERVVARIAGGFPHKYIIEVHVADGSGDSFEVYTGPVQGIAPRHFSNIFREAGCFYSFTVIGILQELTNAVDVHHSNIKRSEFFWLTPPPPPFIICQEDSTSVVLSWTAAAFCGCDIPSTHASGCIEYVLELAEGCEYSMSGKVAKFVTDLTVASYRQTARTFQPTQVHVQDLQPGLRYFARLAIEYLGCRVVSEALCFHTATCPPLAPPVPRIHVAPMVSRIDPSAEPAPSLVLKWSTARANGSSVLKYQVQMQEVLLREAYHQRQDDSYSPLFAKLQLGVVKAAKKILRGGRWVDAIPPSNKCKIAQTQQQQQESPPPHRLGSSTTSSSSSTPYHLDDTVVATRWSSIYCNLDRKVKLVAPRSGTLEWKFRVRAKNAQGWSSFSSVLCIHNRTHPALFAAEYPSHYQGETSYSPSSPAPLRFYSVASGDESASPQGPCTPTLQPPILQQPQPHQQQQGDWQYHREQEQYPSPQQYGEEYYDHMDEAFGVDDVVQGSGVLRRIGPRATSASPSTSHDRRESFSSDRVSAQNSREITEDHSHGLDGGQSGLLDGRSRSAPERR